MEQIYTIASLWLALAVLSAIIAYHLRISIALVEICVGVAAAAVAAALGQGDSIGRQSGVAAFSGLRRGRGPDLFGRGRTRSRRSPDKTEGGHRGRPGQFSRAISGLHGDRLLWNRLGP